jgi:hypothetical protein
MTQLTNVQEKTNRKKLTHSISSHLTSSKHRLLALAQEQTIGVFPRTRRAPRDQILQPSVRKGALDWVVAFVLFARLLLFRLRLLCALLLGRGCCRSRSSWGGGVYHLDILCDSHRDDARLDCCGASCPFQCVGIVAHAYGFAAGGVADGVHGGPARGGRRRGLNGEGGRGELGS